MTMRMMISKANYAKAENEAYKVLEKFSQGELPIKVKKIVKKYKNLSIYSYSRYAKKWGIEHFDVCKIADSEEGCCLYNARKNKYIILYNEKVTNKARIRWTIAHELGHYLLKHNEQTGKSVFSRSSLTDQEYEVLESEANCFARTLLAPPNILSSINDLEPQGIKILCDLSDRASKFVHKFMERGKEKGVIYPEKTELFKLFHPFLQKVNSTYECLDCGNVFNQNSPSYCNNCSSARLLKTIKSEVKDMIYSGFELDNNYRAKVCPRCENEHLMTSRSNCHVCGTFLFNICTGFPEDPSHRYESTSYFHIQNRCENGFLPGNSRFCPDCGSTTSFYEQALLISWQEEKSNYEAESQGETEYPAWLRGTNNY